MKSLFAAVSCAALLGAVAYAQPPSIADFPAQPTKAEAAALAAKAARPGDDTMTCEQLGMEMQPYVMAIQPAAQQVGEAGKELQARGKERQAAALAQAPLSIGAGIISSFLPGGNAIATAQAQAQYAQMQREAAQDKPLTDKVMSGAGQLAAQLGPMQQDPRFQRLMQMAETKKCTGEK